MPILRVDGLTDVCIQYGMPTIDLGLQRWHKWMTNSTCIRSHHDEEEITVNEPPKVQNLLLLRLQFLVLLPKPFNVETLVQYPPGIFQCTLEDLDQAMQSARRPG